MTQTGVEGQAENLGGVCTGVFTQKIRKTSGWRRRVSQAKPSLPGHKWDRGPNGEGMGAARNGSGCKTTGPDY